MLVAQPTHQQNCELLQMGCARIRHSPCGVVRKDFVRPQQRLQLHAEKEKAPPPAGWTANPFKEFSDMISSWDDVIDDFMNKRMGNGELFYGQRKYKPSGRENTQGNYNGMGLSDSVRIDIARERKEDYLAMKRAQEEKKNL
ncbi:hypothetical protein ACA910_010217 [Epithemia clementina (nom. ined.)]